MCLPLDHALTRSRLAPPTVNVQRTLGCVSEWFNLIQNLASHLVERYGLEEVSSWNFEVWNEMWGIGFPEP